MMKSAIGLDVMLVETLGLFQYIYKDGVVEFGDSINYLYISTSITHKQREILRQNS